MRAPEVLRVADITYRQLDHWTRCGYLTPSNPDCGSGRRRDYPMSEVRVCRYMSALVSAGLTVDAAHLVARGDEAATASLIEAIEAIAGAA